MLASITQPGLDQILRFWKNDLKSIKNKDQKSVRKISTLFGILYA